VSNGVPFDLAFLLDESTAAGMAIIFSEFSSGGSKRYDFDYEKWVDTEDE
jgi:hypothetical protein